MARAFRTAAEVAYMEVNYVFCDGAKDRILPMASYWCNCRGFGSFFLRGSGYEGPSGTYGQFREVRGLRRGGSWRLSASRSKAEGLVFPSEVVGVKAAPRIADLGLDSPSAGSDLVRESGSSKEELVL